MDRLAVFLKNHHIFTSGNIQNKAIIVKNGVARSTFPTEIGALSFRVQTFEYIILKKREKNTGHDDLSLPA